MSERAVPRVRKFMGQRLRELRKAQGFSQDRLGDRAHLSGKFVGEVERGEKSISTDSLYRVSTALGVPMRTLVDVPGKRQGTPAPELEALYAMLVRKPPAHIKRVVRLVRAAGE